MFVYRRETLIAKKIGLLQSKRLYPDNNDIEDDDEASFLFGMNAFIRRDGSQAIGALHRNFTFDNTCIYGAIHAGSNQISAIDKFNTDFGKAIYYLLYNPHQLPFSVAYPLQCRTQIDQPVVGCRVFDADQVHRALAGLGEGESPTIDLINREGAASNWRLETWAADLLLTCQVGQQFDDSRDGQVRYLIERRSGPIGAALAASITLAEE
ncbi:MAG: hypothetical protein B7Y70_00015 [Rhizobiales bacterium 35-68-8]|nr:MAG: hypothetical protein B7Y70_00015 [Rhizobiales bacterium 35-68-8]